MNEFQQTVKEIALDIFEARGDIPNDRVAVWAKAYTFWHEASDELTDEQLNDAIDAARQEFLSRD